ncbi:MAG: hypothetical protein K2Z81_19415 [Cyanobacteria bacterium]|nr:hypothetical protein [Cyanobacteriota bacterium]
MNQQGMVLVLSFIEGDVEIEQLETGDETNKGENAMKAIKHANMKLVRAVLKHLNEEVNEFGSPSEKRHSSDNTPEKNNPASKGRVGSL